LRRCSPPPSKSICDGKPHFGRRSLPCAWTADHAPASFRPCRVVDQPCWPKVRSDGRGGRGGRGPGLQAPQEGGSGDLPINLGSWANYAQAVVDIRLPGGTLRIVPQPAGTVEGPFLDDYRSVVHIITAANPENSHLSDDANRRRNADLVAELNRIGIRWWPAWGGSNDGSHGEISAAVAGLSEAVAIDLGRRFQQDAIFAWSHAEWTTVGCADDYRRAVGWRSTMTPSENL